MKNGFLSKYLRFLFSEKNSYGLGTKSNWTHLRKFSSLLCLFSPLSYLSTYAVMYFLPRFLKHFWGLSFIPLMGFFLLSLMMITSSCFFSFPGLLVVLSCQYNNFGLQKLGKIMWYRVFPYGLIQKWIMNQGNLYNSH